MLVPADLPFFASLSLLHAFPVTEGPARLLLSIAMHAAGASACPNVSVSLESTYRHGCLLPTSPGHSEFCKYLTRLRQPVASDLRLAEQAHGGVRQV